MISISELLSPQWQKNAKFIVDTEPGARNIAAVPVSKGEGAAVLDVLSIVAYILIARFR